MDVPGKEKAIALEAEELSARVAQAKGDNGAVPCESMVRCLGPEMGALSTSLDDGSGLRFVLTYQPAELRACMEDLAPAPITDPDMRARVEQLRGTDLYLLRIIPAEGPRTGQSAVRMAQALDDLMDQTKGARLQEVIGTDTLDCAFIHVETAPGFVTYTTLLIGFDTPQDGREREVILKGLKEGESDQLRFRFRQGVFAAYAHAVQMLFTDRT